MGFKIVRDRQREWAQKHGVSGRWRNAEDPINSLSRKLIEEAIEFHEDFDPAELFDVMDVLYELMNLHPGPAMATAYQSHQKKVSELGGFRDAIEWSPVPQESASQELS